MKLAPSCMKNKGRKTARALGVDQNQHLLAQESGEGRLAPALSDIPLSLEDSG